MAYQAEHICGRRFTNRSARRKFCRKWKAFLKSDCKSSSRALTRRSQPVSRNDLNGCCCHSSLPIFLHISPRNLGIVGEDGEPLLRNCMRIILLAAFDGIKREQIERHHPSQVEMGRGGNQVRDVAGGLVGATNDDRLHVASMSRKDFYRDAGNDFLVTS